MKSTYFELESGRVIETISPQFYKDCKRLTVAEGKRRMIAHARERLLEMLKPGDRIYTVLRHVSASGMSRRIDLYKMTVDPDGTARPQFLSGYAATLCGWSQHASKPGIVVGGCGMDMGFHLVYTLGQYLWPEGTPEPHGTRNGEPDSAGGYALKHEWL